MIRSRPKQSNRDRVRVAEWSRFLREDGSLTMEASLIVPWILLICMALVLLLPSETRKVIVYYSASIAAERTAFAWAHSRSDLRTGSYPPDGYDGLYGRLGRDELLSVLSGASAGRKETEVAFGPGSPGEAGGSSDDGSAAGKLRKTAQAMAGGLSGTLAYRNEIWKRTVAVRAEGGTVAKPLVKLRLAAAPRVSASAVAWVAEPVETIRVFDLIGYYRAKIRSKGEGSAEYRERAAETLRTQEGGN